MEAKSSLLFPELGEAGRYHDAGRFGFVTISAKCKGRWQEDKFRVQDLPDRLRYLDRSRDSFLTQAEFKRPTRAISNFLRVSTSFIDLDTYRVPTYQGRDKEELADGTLLYCQDNGIPRPNLLLSSGRGLYAKWLYDAPVPYGAFSKWQAVQRELVEKLSSLGADRGAIDVSRVLRIENTVNTKVGECVQVIYDDGGSWNFDDLAQEVLPYTPEELKRIQEARNAKAVIRSFKRQNRTDIRKAVERINTFSMQTLAAARLWDLQYVVVPRMFGQEVPPGMRDKVLFTGASCIAWFIQKRPLEFDRELKAFHQNIVPSLSLREVREYTSTIRKRLEAANKLYRMTRTERLIDYLEIPVDVQRYCKTIVGREVKNERDKQRKDRLRRESGIVKREEYEEKRKGELHENIHQAKELKHSGLTVGEIMARMSKSERMVRYYLKS